MAKFHFIAHCYAAELTHYADLLVYFLSGFALHPSKDHEVKATVLTAPNDRRTIDRFSLTRSKVADLVLMEPRLLGKRCIGRNRVAMFSDADFVVFTDIDHVWWSESLGAIAEAKWENASMIFPRTINISKDHSTGDRAAARVLPGSLSDIRVKEFTTKIYNRAIGGVQIVQGGFAREHGYLDGTPWQVPLSMSAEQQPFCSFRDDVAYRQFCLQHGPIKCVDLPGIFRIRHSRTSYQ